MVVLLFLFVVLVLGETGENYGLGYINELDEDQYAAHLVSTALRNSKITKESGRRATPAAFDWYAQYPTCIRPPNNQGKCGCCWVAATAQAATARICKKYVDIGGYDAGWVANVSVSAQNLVSCWNEMVADGDHRSVCLGGSVDKAMGALFKKDAAGTNCVPDTGYECGSTQDDCFKFTVYNTGPYGSVLRSCPDLSNSCPDDNSYWSWVNDRYYAVSKTPFWSGTLSGSEDNIKQEIYSNGPIVVSFDVYEDFHSGYSGGIYNFSNGIYKGGHAVVMYGWGEETGTPFWRLKNSWGTSWGETAPGMSTKGYFRFYRGEKDCCSIKDRPYIVVMDNSPPYCYPECTALQNCVGKNNCTGGCSPGFCENGGTCDGDSHCSCINGWTGDACNGFVCTPADFCKNGGTCNGPNNCSCINDWTGDDCTEFVCTPEGFCKNGGNCSSPNKCTCINDWTGYDCSGFSCTAGFCQNGKLCDGPNHCDCEGEFSEDDCSGFGCNPACKNLGKCIFLNNCSCVNGWTGSDCSTFSCDSGFCKNGGTCDSPNHCSCIGGWTGSDCTGFSCSAGYCKNNSTCKEPEKCECVSGWEGDACTVVSTTDNDGDGDDGDKKKNDATTGLTPGETLGITFGALGGTAAGLIGLVAVCLFCSLILLCVIVFIFVVCAVGVIFVAVLCCGGTTTLGGGGLVGIGAIKAMGGGGGSGGIEPSGSISSGISEHEAKGFSSYEEGLPKFPPKNDFNVEKPAPSFSQPKLPSLPAQNIPLAPPPNIMKPQRNFAPPPMNPNVAPGMEKPSFSKPFVKPAAKPFFDSVPKAFVKPVPKPYVKPVPNAFVKPVPKAFVKPVPKPYVKPVPKAFVKPVPKPYVKPVPKPYVKPVPKAFVKPVPKAFVKPVPNAFAKPVPKPYSNNTPSRPNFRGTPPIPFGSKPQLQPLSPKRPARSFIPQKTEPVKPKVLFKKPPPKPMGRKPSPGIPSTNRAPPKPAGRQNRPPIKPRGKSKPSVPDGRKRPVIPRRNF